MESAEAHNRMWVDILTSEISATAARHGVTERALLYLAVGLPLDRVLDALRSSPATWYQRVSEHEQRRENALTALQGASEAAGPP